MAKKNYTVGQVNGYIKNIVNSDCFLGNIYIKGEVSNCKYHSSGHIYFSLKDETGSLAAIMFKSCAEAGLDFMLQDGQLVVAHGGVNVYERDGKYQLYVKDVALDGAGELYARYEQLKQKLYDQGLFEFDIKKPIPKYPKKVGIVTAKTGAAIQDILNIARRRNPYVQLILYPAIVQGETAAADIAKGIEVLDAMGLDTIIIGRGGGSIEDLWAFNEEVVAWAIFNAKTPIISGTGHEVDNTIADYVADLRAPTPSAACELAIPDVMTTFATLDTQLDQLNRIMANKVNVALDKVRSYDRQLHLLNPTKKLADKQIYIDTLTDKMHAAMRLKYDRMAERCAQVDKDIHTFMQLKYERVDVRFKLLCERLNGLSPLAKLVNGFGYIATDDEPIRSIAAVNVGDDVRVTVHDGSFVATVNAKENA